MKVDFITLHPDNTASVRKCKTKKNQVLVQRNWKPEFTEGKCVFPVEQKMFFGLIKRHKRLMIGVEGAPNCLELEEKATKVFGSSWNLSELKDYIAKLTHLSLAAQKPWSNLQAIALFALMMFNLILTLLVARRVGF